MDSLVLSLQCGNVAAAFVPSNDRDMSLKSENVVPEGWILFLLCNT